MRFLIYPAVILIAVIAVLSTAYAQNWCAIQEKLQASGDYEGKIDCIPGPGTMQAVRSYESRTGKPVYKRDGGEQPTSNGFICADRIISASDQRWRKGAALKEAIKAWRAAVLKDEDLGVNYSSWERAADKNTEGCENPGTFQHICTVYARPCRARTPDDN